MSSSSSGPSDAVTLKRTSGGKDDNRTQILATLRGGGVPILRLLAWVGRVMFLSDITMIPKSSASDAQTLSHGISWSCETWPVVSLVHTALTMPPTAYFDHNATTPLDERVLEAMLPYFRERFGNASCLYELGVEASYAVEKARMQVAALIGASEDEIIFTSGGTESDNLAIRGVLEATGKRHIVTSRIEHPAVLVACERLEAKGVEVIRIGVDSDGRVSPDAIDAAITSDTALVSIMTANNEIGAIQPIGAIGDVCNRRGVPFHTDAAQAVGRVPISVDALGVNLLSLSAHKHYGPKGVGALYVRTGTPFAPQQAGGGQEHGRRAGTENVPGVVGLGAAAQLAGREMQEREARIERLREMLWEGLSESTEGILRNSPRTECLAGTLNICLPGAASREVVRAISAYGFCITSGSACAQGLSKPSYVLQAIGRSDEEALSALRVSLGSGNSADEVRRFTQCLPEVIREVAASQTQN